LFEYGQKICKSRGLILVDTKYEFGRTREGKIVVIDEIHTADSSRFWFEDSYTSAFESGADPKSFDKDYVRRWLIEQGYTGDGQSPTLPDEIRIEAAARYISSCDIIRGDSFVPNAEEPISRITENLNIL
jgi:phosphoribosylaminoimidazole-succinocarboxamide synthase